MDSATNKFLLALAKSLRAMLVAFDAWIKSQEPPKPVPTPAPAPLPTLPALASLAKYNEQMITKGKAQLGNRDAIIANTLWEGNAWYYDGIRVAYQIADYTGDKSFAEYAKNPLDVYRPYVIDNKAQVGGWRVFAQGLRMDYERTGNAQSKAAVLELLNAPYGANANPSSLAGEDLSREVAYAIETMLEAEKLGEKRNPKLAQYVDAALGHLDQWFVSGKFQQCYPFMFGLTAEALIKYYEVTADKRILPALKIGADAVWEKAWRPAGLYLNEKGVQVTLAAGFYYDPAYPTNPAPDLNLLIVPVFGWIYSQTGDKSYIEKGDQIFTGGVDGAWLDEGKQFNQSYRWSMDYLKWRGAKATEALK